MASIPFRRRQRRHPRLGRRGRVLAAAPPGTCGCWEAPGSRQLRASATRVPATASWSWASTGSPRRSSAIAHQFWGSAPLRPKSLP